MEEKVSRMERLHHDLAMFLNRDDDSMTMTIYKKEAEKLDQYIYEFDIPVKTKQNQITAERVIYVIEKL